MERDQVITLNPVSHPDRRVRQVGFGLTDPYVEQCWSAVVGPSTTLLLRRLPELWREHQPAQIEASELGRSLGHADVVQVALGDGDDGRIGFGVDGRELVTRLLAGDFPKYEQLLPKESHTVATVDTAGLIEAVKRVKLVAAERTTPIRLQFSDSEVLLRAGAYDDAQASESLECSMTGDTIEIAFNPDYLLDGLAASGTEQTTLSFTTANKPAILGPAADAASYQYLLMPVRLSN